MSSHRNLFLAIRFIVYGVSALILVAILAVILVTMRDKGINHKVEADKASLRMLATAMESYSCDYNCYPVPLSCLLTAMVGEGMQPRNAPPRSSVSPPRERHPFLTELPHSALDEKVFPQCYAYPPDKPRQQRCFWMIWWPGPDGRFDLAPDDNLKSALDDFYSVKHAPYRDTWMPAYVIERVYDPSNGAYSKGDILRCKQ